ncbi:MAG: SDR family oxidoreductase [Candidatus Algichlamydia australiensis]|nr:SDR family oxidoreductase [Chlamydiales bacterium]
MLKLTKREVGEALALCRKASQDLKSLDVTIEENVDVRDEKSLERVKQQHSDKQFDLLINNAGIYLRMTLENIDFNAIQEQFEVNTLAPLKTSLAFLPLLKKGGKIAMISSRAGSIGDLASGGQYGYRPSKAALNMVSAILAKDLKEQEIAVAVLHPGYVKTDMTSGKGDLTVEESVAGLVQRIDELTLETSGTF